MGRCRSAQHYYEWEHCTGLNWESSYSRLLCKILHYKNEINQWWCTALKRWHCLRETAWDWLSGSGEGLCCKLGLAKLAESQQPFCSWENLKDNSPSDAHTREAKAAAAAGTGADLEVTIFKTLEEQLLTSALFNHHHQELVDNYGKKSRRGRKCQLERACAGQCCLLSRVFTACALQSTKILALAVKKLLLSITLEDQNCPNLTERGINWGTEQLWNFLKLHWWLVGRVSIKAQVFLAQVLTAIFFHQLSSPDWSKLFRTSPLPPLK